MALGSSLPPPVGLRRGICQTATSSSRRRPSALSEGGGARPWALGPPPPLKAPPPQPAAPLAKSLLSSATQPQARYTAPVAWPWSRGGGPKDTSAPPPCGIPSGGGFFARPWTVTRSSLRMLRRVAAFCRPLRPVLPLVSLPRPWSPVVGALGVVPVVAGFVLRSLLPTPLRILVVHHMPRRASACVRPSCSTPSACRAGHPPPASPWRRKPHVLHPGAWCTWALRAPAWPPRASCAPPRVARAPLWWHGWFARHCARAPSSLVLPHLVLSRVLPFPGQPHITIGRPRGPSGGPMGAASPGR